MIKNKLTPEQFWKSEKVKQIQNIQMRHPWGSAEDKAAHDSLVAYAKECGVFSQIKDLDIY